jgi:hypothetical protein
MDSNADYALDLSLSINGRVIAEFTKEPAYAIRAASRKTFVRSALWTYNSAYLWRFEIKDAARTESIC